VGLTVDVDVFFLTECRWCLGSVYLWPPVKKNSTRISRLDLSLRLYDYALLIVFMPHGDVSQSVFPFTLNM
jgi:hypothetical protein